MTETLRYNIDELFQKSTLSFAELGRRSGLCETTVSNISQGKRARRHSINKLLATFAQLYNATLTVENVDGLRTVNEPHNEGYNK
jgi:transcriptional regulator with XRE-family HTH domain